MRAPHLVRASQRARAPALAVLQWPSKASEGKEKGVSQIEKHASEGKCHLKDQGAGGE